MGDLILVFLITGFATTMLAAILLTIYKRKIAFDERVEAYFGGSVVKNNQAFQETQKSEIKLVLDQYWERGTDALNKKVSKEERKRMESMLRDAGYPFKSAVDFRLFQLFLSAGMGLAIFLLFFPIAENKTIAWIMVATMALLGFRLPVFYLGKKKTARIKAIEKQMPDYFDTVNLLLEAGMGLDLALKEVSYHSKGPLSDEFLLTLEDMKLGKSRREAFYELRRRVPSHSLQSIITSLIQADQLGIGMAKVLGNLTLRVREQRREAAREQAMKAPVKMLFPMVFFIFPSLFIVLLGPLVITLVTKGLGG